MEHLKEYAASLLAFVLFIPLTLAIFAVTVVIVVWGAVEYIQEIGLWNVLRQQFCGIVLGHPERQIGDFAGGIYLYDHSCGRCGAKWIDRA